MTLGAAPGSGNEDAVAHVNAGSPTAADSAASLPLSSHSRFVQRLRRRYAAELPLLPGGPPALQSISAAYEALRSSGHDVGCALRVLRQLVLERLATLDCDQHAPLGTITA